MVVGIDSVVDLNLDALAAMESQFLEGGVEGIEAKMPKNKAEYDKGQEKVKDGFRNQFKGTADKYRDKLIEIYGPEKGKAFRYAQAFEVCEYGNRPDMEELKKLFPIGE
jgi:N-acetylglucosamine malate deacetylase 1